MAFPLPPKLMGAPSSRSWVRFPGPDGGPAYLDSPDWPSHGVTSRRPRARARPAEQPVVEKFRAGRCEGAVHTLFAQLSCGPLPEGCRGCRAVWEFHDRDSGDGGCWRGCDALRARGTERCVGRGSGKCDTLSHPRDLTRGSDPAVTDLQGSGDQTVGAGSLFNASECVAAERRQFVGKQTPGWGRNHLAPSPLHTHAARTPSRGAQGLASRDRRDCASPLPHPPNPGFRFRQWPRLVATPQLLLAPEAARGIRSLGFCPCDAPPFPWRLLRMKLCTNWDKIREWKLVQFDGSSEGVGNAAGLAQWPHFQSVCRTCL